MNTLKKRRSVVALIILLIAIISGLGLSVDTTTQQPTPNDVLSDNDQTTELAVDVLARLDIKGRAPKTGYSRDEFGSGWASIDGCDMRNIILERSLEQVELDEDGCTVRRGILQDPYTAAEIQFIRGPDTSNDIQIDHVVALSDAWQKGAQNLEFSDRVVFANDPLNLLAVDGPANQEKGDSDAASWLPPNKAYRCQYVARQIAVKDTYNLWVTEAEYAAMKRVLNGCGGQRVPFVE